MTKMDKNFQLKIQGKDVLVLFYAPWWGFSRRFLPFFKEYSKSCSTDCKIVDKEESPELCKYYSIDYYPTVILFKNGKVDRRLDSKPGIGLSEAQLEEFASDDNK